MRKFLLATTLVFLGAASPAYAGNGNIIGTLLGGALGGFLGNQFGHGVGRDALTVGGVIAGGLIGGHIGSEIDREERYYGSGAPYWSAGGMYSDQPNASHYVPNYVAPSAPEPASFGTYNTAVDAYCRPFAQPVQVGSRIVQTFVTACQQPDGSWLVLQ